MVDTQQLSAADVLQRAASTFAAHAAQQPTELYPATESLINSLQTHQDAPGMRCTQSTNLITTHTHHAGLQDSFRAVNSILTDLLPRLQDAIDQLDACITSHPPSLRDPTILPPPQQDLAQAARQTLQFAHRLSYTTFAPPGYIPGGPLGLFRPPAPQEHQMCFSGLHQLSNEITAAAAAPPQPEAPADPAAAITTMLAGMGIVLPPGFRPPPPPPGWKPGDAIDFPPELLAQLASLAAAPPQPAAPAEAEGMDFGLMLDDELQVEVASEGSSEEESDEEESI